jgi:orotidine 5'-phosphate decarboxylase subfamily 2
LCFGVDPVKEKMPSGVSISNFFGSMIDTLLNEHQIASIKPNYAFFAQYGFDGLKELKGLLDKYKDKTHIILDAKRGDIGTTGMAYAKEIFDFWGADAVTISPYMGFDSVEPFLREGKTVYMLCKTSNKGSNDFQEIVDSKGEKLYAHVAKKAVEWKTGLVVGATSDSIKSITSITKDQVPFLIPGVGTQGGDLDMVLNAIKANPKIHRINSSSGISYAYQKTGEKPEVSAVNEAKKLNTLIGKLFPK